MLELLITNDQFFGENSVEVYSLSDWYKTSVRSSPSWRSSCVSPMVPLGVSNPVAEVCLFNGLENEH
jgi:hypothetical protein